MADTGDNLGDLTVNVTGDFSELQDAIDQSVTVAQSGSEAIASALQGVSVASGLAGRDLEIFQQIVQQDTDAGIALSQSLEDLSNSASQVGDTIAGGAAAALESLQSTEEGAGEAASGAAGDVDELGSATENASEAAGEGESAFGELAETITELSGIAITAEALKEFATEALETYANVEKATIALGALTGSSATATEAIESLKSLALSDALSFPTLVTAYQRMVAFGIEADLIPGVLQAAADAAAATGRNIDSVTNSLDRMALSGNAGARQLATLGITLDDLATALGVTDAAAKQAFKDLDVSDRVVAIETALQKYQGVAQAVAQGVAGQFQNLQTKTEFVFESMGEAIAPAAAAVMGFASNVVLPAAQLIANQFGNAGRAESDFGNAAVLAAGTAANSLKSMSTEIGAAVSAISPGLGQTIAAFGNTTSDAQSMGAAIKEVAEGSFIDAFVPGVRLASNYLDELTLAIENFVNNSPGADAMIQRLTNSLHQFQSAATMGGAAFTAAFNLSKAQAGLNNFGGEIQSVSGKILQMQGAIQGTKDSITTLTAAQQAGTTVLANGVSVVDALAAENVKLTAEQKALNTALGDTTKATQPAADSIQALGDAITKDSGTFDNANTTYANMLSAYQRGDTTLNGVALNGNTITIAYNNLANAYLKATGQVLQWTATAPQVQQAAQTEINASTSLQNNLNQQLAAWQNLSNAGPQFAIAASLAFEKVQSAGKALGIQVTETANGLQFTLADGSKIAADAVQPLIDKLNTLYGVQVETVTVNGQAVRTFQSLGQTLQDGETAVGQFGQTANLSANGVLVFKGASDSAGQSFDATQTKIINFNGTVASLTGTVVDNSHTITDATNGAIQYTQSMQDAADGVDNFTVIENDLTQSATDATGATNAEADKLLDLAKAADDAADAVDNLNSANSKLGKGGAGGGTSLSGLLEGAIAASQGGGTSETVGSDFNQSQVDEMAQELADASGQVVTTLDGMFIPATQAAATQLAALQAQANATGKSFTVDLNGAITTITASTTANTTATTANTTATTTNTTATAASTTATITQTQAQTNLAAAVTQYQTDLASGSATAQQLTLDLANVGSAEQGLTTTATQTMQALTQATTATDAATNALAILSPTVDVAGFTLSNAVQATVQPLADASSGAETLSQAEAGAAQTVDEGTNALGVMTTGIQSSTNGLWTFVQSLNGVVQSMSYAMANLGDLAFAAQTVVAPLNSVQQAMQQLNADLAAYNAGGGSLATVRADQAALQTAQLASSLTIENLGNLAMAAQTVVAPLTSVQQAMNQLNSDLASFGTNIRANLTPTQNSTIDSDQAALQTAQLATLPTTSMVPGSASWQYVNPNPDLMSAPTGNGPDMSIPSESTSTGVNLVVNVTGNSVTSAALVDQLANKVSSVIVTNLRTNAGLKN